MIRKFEQEAIVNQIMVGVEERLDKEIEKAKKKKGYKNLAKQKDNLYKMDQVIKRMQEERSQMCSQLNDTIKEFNNSLDVEHISISTIVYNNDAHNEVSWLKSMHQMRWEIADKLSVALLDSRDKRLIKDVIAQIIKEVSL
jgi:glutaredoxin 2|tara:strand:+ start:236 stop:658 length:423 start_codon:yes stop_codon:yes gene_type:complete